MNKLKFTSHLLLLFAPMLSADVLDLPDIPLLLSQESSHNMFITLDNSNSMGSKWGGATIESSLNSNHRSRIPETNSLTYNTLTNYSKWVGKKSDGTDFYPDITDLTAVKKMSNSGWGEGKLRSSTTNYKRSSNSWNSWDYKFGTETFLDVFPVRYSSYLIGTRYRADNYKQKFRIITQRSNNRDERGNDAALNWIANPPSYLTQNFSYVQSSGGKLYIDGSGNLNFYKVGKMPASGITCDPWTYQPSTPYDITEQNEDGYYIPTGEIGYTPEYSRRYCYVDFTSSILSPVIVTVNGETVNLGSIHGDWTVKLSGSSYPYYFRVWDDLNDDGKMLSYSESKLYRIAPNTTFPSGRTWEEELRNYAYWDLYNSNRIRVAKSALSQLLDSMDHSDTIHLEYGVLNDFTGNRKRSVLMSDLSINNNESTLLQNLFNTRHIYETPLREKIAEIGGSLITNVNDVYFRSDGGQDGSCTKNYNVLISDGAWSEDNSFSLVGNADGNNDTAFDGSVYSDAWSNTLADVAMHFYEKDLQPGLPDDVVPTATDLATHQHLTNHIIGFNLNGNLTDSDDLELGVTWPEPDDSKSKVDDIRHAAFNSRGGYYSANNIDELSSTLTDIADTINAEIINSLSPISISTTKLDTGTRLFAANFEADMWTGHLSAYKLENIEAGKINETALFDAGTVLTERDIIVSPRIIITYNKDTRSGVEFKVGNIDADMLADLSFTTIPGQTSSELSTMIEDRIKWFYGYKIYPDDAPLGYVLPGDTLPETSLVDRKRKSRLGDIINSNPVYVASPSSRSIDSSYLAFKDTYKNRTPMVYIGANDGLLHAFDATTGEEKFAYLPSALSSDDEKNGYHFLTQSSYTHKYYVDGSITVSDVEINGAWRTILVGSYRSGGKGYFALDITDPSTFASTSNVASRVLWEFDENDYSDLGYSFSRAKIIKGNDDMWHVGFGNGVNSQSGVSSLVLLKLQSGMDGNWSDSGDFKVIQTNDNTNNALFSPTFIDIDNNGLVDFAYAGDLNGSLWKFDLSTGSPSSWSLDLKLFETASGESITTAPSLSIVRGQLMVFVGAGRFITDDDKDNANDKQRYFYGFIDDNDFVDGSTDLLEQTLNSNFPGQRVLTDHSIDFDDGQKGWKIKLEDAGEMNVTRSILRDGIVFFNTFSPTPGSCGSLGYGYKYAAKMSNGGEPSGAIFDINGDGVVDALDDVTNSSGDSGVVSSIKADGYLPEPVFVEDNQFTNLESQKVIPLKDFKTGIIYWIELK